MPSFVTTAFVSFILFRFAEAKQKKESGYSDNAICMQYNCINPIFPAMEDLRRMEASQLQCQPSHETKKHMKFCKNAVYYDVALPSPNKTSKNVSDVVLMQDNAAATSYYYHLAGMNVDAWDNREPENGDDECTKSIWRMVCNTYFPRAQAGCKKGEPTKHLRPCKNVCASYLQACSVECCDESVKCNWNEKIALVDGTEAVSSGYHDEAGPSAYCTGGASRKSPSVFALILASLPLLRFMIPGRPSSGASDAKGGKSTWKTAKKLAMCIVLFALCSQLQGCLVGQLFSHPTPAWEMKLNYWDRFEYIPPGAPATKRIFNSCDALLPKDQQCSGHGVCQPWQSELRESKLVDAEFSFCKCFRDWADPECRTQRKSQFNAYFISVFFGLFGGDHFYLQNFYSGFAKFATGGGLGVWWIYDIVRLGAAPVYTDEFRLAYDLPHWLYVLFTVTFFSCLGLCAAAIITRALAYEEARQALLQKNDKLHQAHLRKEVNFNPEDELRMPRFASYPLPMPMQAAYGVQYGALNAPPAVKNSSELNPFSPYAVWNHAVQGYGGPHNAFDSRAQPTNPALHQWKMQQAPPEGVDMNQLNGYPGAEEYGY